MHFILFLKVMFVYLHLLLQFQVSLLFNSILSGLKKTEKKSHVVLKHTDLAKSRSLAHHIYYKGIRELEESSLSSSLRSPWLLRLTQGQSHRSGRSDTLAGVHPLHKENASNPVLPTRFHEDWFCASRIWLHPLQLP